MADISRGQTFGATETVTNTKLHNLVDNAYITNIVNDDCDANMDLVDTKLRDITTGGKVRGAALLNLPSIPSGAGLVPYANIPPTTLVSIPNSSLYPITLASWVSGSSFKNLASIPSGAGQMYYTALVASLGSGSVPIFNGLTNFVGAAIGKIVIFTSSGTFVAPAGVTKVYLSMVGGGGGGGGSASANEGGGGGGGGGSIINYPFTVIPGNSYTVTIGAGGSGGDTSPSAGNNGSATSFDTVSVPGGSGGASSSTGSGGSGGGGLDATTITAGLGSIKGGNGGNDVSTQGGGAGGGTPFGAGAATGGNASNGVAGTSNTGAGGSGGCSNSFSGGNGGSGICVVMY